MKRIKKLRRLDPAKFTQCFLEFRKSGSFSKFKRLLHTVTRSVTKFQRSENMVLNRKGFFRFYYRMGFKEKAIDVMWKTEVDEAGTKLVRRGPRSNKRKMLVMQGDDKEGIEQTLTKSRAMQKDEHLKKKDSNNEAGEFSSSSQSDEESSESSTNQDESEGAEESEESGDDNDGELEEEGEEEAEASAEEEEDEEEAENDEAEGEEEEEESESEDESPSPPPVTPAKRNYRGSASSVGAMSKSGTKGNDGKSEGNVESSGKKKQHMSADEKKVANLLHAVQKADGVFDESADMWEIQEILSDLVSLKFHTDRVVTEKSHCLNLFLSISQVGSINA